MRHHAHPHRADYAAALKLVEPYFDIDHEPDSDEGAPLGGACAAGLGLKHYPSKPSNLGDAIKFRMESQVAGKWYQAVAQPD